MNALAPIKKGYAQGTSGRRFESFEARGSRFNLADDHPAIVEGRTIMPKRVFAPTEVKRILVSGKNSRKIGDRVARGRWAGAPIFTLTLEERATCPRTCAEWKTCYGSNMNWAKRIAHGPEFESMLWAELEAKQAAHPAGFVVRLHVLGDFYSVAYAELWGEAMAAFPALRVFGYTAHAPDSEIGRIIGRLNERHADRFAYRFSGLDEPERGSVVIEPGADTPHTVCLAQRSLTNAAGDKKAECCATCALCWQSPRTIAFWRH
ncbi:hypothetical protein [Sphingomonas leidyi]|uniref:GP88 family protein n=1 Tax=Sphingomonas leidyi TaxID=68569 RepID=UPI0036D2C484